MEASFREMQLSSCPQLNYAIEIERRRAITCAGIILVKIGPFKRNKVYVSPAFEAEPTWPRTLMHSPIVSAELYQS